VRLHFLVRSYCACRIGQLCPIGFLFCARLQGTVRLLFQPAEEGGAGGDVFVKEGIHE
jgi:hypothetical protein